MSNETIRKYLSDIDNLALQVETAKNIDYYVRKNVGEIAEYTKKQILAAAKRKKTASSDDIIEIAGDERSAEEIYNAVATDFRRILEKSREVYIFDTREYYYESPINIALRNKVAMYESLLKGTSNKIAILMAEKTALEQQISDLKQQVDDKTAENKTLQTKLNKLMSALEETKRLLADSERLRDDEIRKMTEELKKYKEQLDAETEQHKRQRDFLGIQIGLVTNENEMINRRFDNIADRNRRLGEQNKQLEKEKKQLEKEKAGLRADYEQVLGNSNNLIEKMNDRDNVIKQLQGQLAECKQALAEVDHVHNVIVENNNNTEQLQEEYDTHKKKSDGSVVYLRSVQDKIVGYDKLRKECDEIQQKNTRLSQLADGQRRKIAAQESTINRQQAKLAFKKADNDLARQQTQELEKINKENRQLRVEAEKLKDQLEELKKQLSELNRSKNTLPQPIEEKLPQSSSSLPQPIEEKPPQSSDALPPPLIHAKSGAPMDIINSLHKLIEFLEKEDISEAAYQIDYLMGLIVNNNEVETKFKTNYEKLKRAIEDKDREIARIRAEYETTKQNLDNALNETMDARLFVAAVAKRGGDNGDTKEIKELFKNNYNLNFHEMLLHVKKFINDSKEACIKAVRSERKDKLTNSASTTADKIIQRIDLFMAPGQFGDPNNKTRFQQIFIELLGNINTDAAKKLQELVGQISANILENKKPPIYVDIQENNNKEKEWAKEIKKDYYLYEGTFTEIKYENLDTIRMACAVILVNSAIGTLTKKLPIVFDTNTKVVYDKIRELFVQNGKSILVVNPAKTGGGGPTTESPMALAPILSVIAAPIISTTALIITLAIAVIIFIFYVLYVIDTQSKIETPTRYIIEYRECQSQP